MNLRRGEMWSTWEEADHFLITTNGSITYDGRLVMGRGIARQANQRFPGLDKKLAAHIRHLSNTEWYKAHWVSSREAYVYGALFGKKLGIFQVKWQWSQHADVALMRYSASLLDKHARVYPQHQYHLNFPGIGNGHLVREQVLPIIARLPDNVTVWEFPV